MSFGQFTVAELPLEKFSAKVEVGEKSLQLTHITAKLGGGNVDGDWKLDWSGSQPRYTATGAMSGVILEKLPATLPDVALLTSWVTGKADFKYSVRFEGSASKDMLSSTSGKLEYSVSNGASKALLLDSTKPLRFQSLQGSAELEKQALKILPSKFRSENRIYELSGTMSLTDKQARLKVTNNTARWEITGALDQPKIAAQPAPASSARSR